MSEVHFPLASQINELAGHLNAANRRWLALIAEFDRRQGWSDWVTRSCTHWLNWQCGIDLGVARDRGGGTRARGAATVDTGDVLTWDDDGSLVVRARLPAEAGLLLLRALEAAEATLPAPEQDVSAETRASLTRTARRADALEALAESFLVHGAGTLNGGERLDHVWAIDVLVQRRARGQAMHAADQSGRVSAETSGPRYTASQDTRSPITRSFSGSL